MFNLFQYQEPNNYKSDFELCTPFENDNEDFKPSKIELPFDMAYPQDTFVLGFDQNNNHEVFSSADSHFDSSTHLSQQTGEKIERNCIQSFNSKKGCDYNDMVDEIIAISCNSGKKETTEEQFETAQSKLIIRNRRKLRKTEIGLLNEEFEKNPNWDKKFIAKLAKKVGLPYYKVYKWNWDQKKKHEIPVSKSKSPKHSLCY